MRFINELNFPPIPDFLDTEDKVKDAWETLRASTEEAFKELDRAKMASWEGAHRIFVD